MAKIRIHRLAIGLLLFPALLHAAEIQGADAILKRIAAGPGEAGPASSPLRSLKKRITDFQKAAATLPPEKAADEWLAILDAWLALPASERLHPLMSGSGEVSMELILESLPPSSAWDPLAAHLRQHVAGKEPFRQAAFSFLAAVLDGDLKARLAIFEQIRDLIAKAPSGSVAQGPSNSLLRLEQLNERLSAEADANYNPVEAFRLTLKSAERGDRNSYLQSSVPSLAGVPDAKELLLRLLRTDLTYANFQDEATRRLAAEAAMENIDQLQKAPWFLVQDGNDLELLEALERKFPSRQGDYQQIVPRLPSLRFEGLVRLGKNGEALAILTDPRQAVSIQSFFTAGEAGDEKFLKELYDLFSAALSSDPNLPLWRSASRYAENSRETADFAALLEKSLASDKLTVPAAQSDVEDLYLTFLLGSGRTDEALAFLEKQIEQLRNEPSGPFANTSPPPVADPFGEASMTSASRLLHLLGRSVAIHTLLGKNDLVARDLDRIVSAFPKEAEARLGSSTLLSFVKHGKAAEAEKLIADQLVRLSRPADSSPYSSSSYQTSSLLEQLVQLYGALGRHEDIVRLLDDCPLWSAGELARLGDMFSRPVPLIAAKALAATGRKNDAERIARWAILTQPNDDAGYALLTELNPPDLIPFLDQVATGNRFEERPLIWKANALAEKGALDEAETLIRKAIAIDPSDGEQGKGNRMRAYEVLADILGKKGDAQQSGFFRKVVSAIRQSEEADDWWSAGLIPQAIARYQKALESFADAYCIQSRLALRYASVGDKEKAAVHFQRAFELMPDSFGRIESHCFGCEGAFNSETAQAIAEKVFTELASRPDAKPQVHYLLGYLRSSQGRSGEATVHFRKAVEMDPDYINAWKKLAELPAASSEEADEVTFALLRLSGPQMPIDHVSDLRRLWDFLLEAEKTLPPPPPSSIYPLRAAAAARPSGSPQYGMVSPSESLRSNFTRHPLVNAAGLFFEPSSLRY